jgi:hypothetical protein
MIAVDHWGPQQSTAITKTGLTRVRGVPPGASRAPRSRERGRPGVGPRASIGLAMSTFGWQRATLGNKCTVDARDAVSASAPSEALRSALALTRRASRPGPVPVREAGAGAGPAGRPRCHARALTGATRRSGVADQRRAARTCRAMAFSPRALGCTGLASEVGTIPSIHLVPGARHRSWPMLSV